MVVCRPIVQLAVWFACLRYATCSAPDCWEGTITEEFCCDLTISPQGRMECWVDGFTYEYCCDVFITYFQEQLRKGSGSLSEYVRDPSLVELYLSTLRDTLTGIALKTPSVIPSGVKVPFKDTDRIDGALWCDQCYSMAGTARLSTLRRLLEQTFADSVPGDYVEAGVWRGGTGIFARAVQRANGQGAERQVIMCDSFRGLPTASTDDDSNHWSTLAYLQVPLGQVRDHFERFQMLDSSVIFAKGVFMRTLPLLRERLQSMGRQISVLFGDGDMFESYYDTLYNLYEFVPIGGYVWCDDCSDTGPEAWKAINMFRAEHGIDEPIMDIEGSYIGRYWRKARHVTVDYSRYLVWNATRVIE